MENIFSSDEFWLYSQKKIVLEKEKRKKCTDFYDHTFEEKKFFKNSLKNQA